MLHFVNEYNYFILVHNIIIFYLYFTAHCIQPIK